MTINANCLNQIATLMALPSTLDVLDRYGNAWTTAEILPDGRIVCHSNQTTYRNPSHLRQDLILRNSGTYKFFKYNGRTLHDLGVVP
jgi:hypothetical protein